jgi:hypothetical protein
MNRETFPAPKIFRENKYSIDIIEIVELQHE